MSREAGDGPDGPLNVATHITAISATNNMPLMQHYDPAQAGSTCGVDGGHTTVCDAASQTSQQRCTGQQRLKAVASGAAAIRKPSGSSGLGNGLALLAALRCPARHLSGRDSPAEGRRTSRRTGRRVSLVEECGALVERRVRWVCDEAMWDSAGQCVLFVVLPRVPLRAPSLLTSGQAEYDSATTLFKHLRSGVVPHYARRRSVR